MKSLIQQIKGSKVKRTKHKKEYDGNTETMISTGSTLLDQAITGGRVRGGGLPGGIIVEIFGPNGSGKTVLLCEIGGAVQRAGGDLLFRDPEARLNKQFAKIFDLDPDDMDYGTPDKVPQLFQGIRSWEPSNDKKINAILADSLAALSTDLEMDNEDGDKMGMRRAKEFSEEFRRTARIIQSKNYLMCCTNQIRQSGSGGYGEKYISPGGMAIGFYASVRLKINDKQKLIDKKKLHGKEIKKVYGVKMNVEVYKNSTWKPYRTAPVYISFDYGIDDIRANLQYLKDTSSDKTYTVDGESFKAIDDAIDFVEKHDLENDIKEETIDRWEEIEVMFQKKRKKKKR